MPRIWQSATAAAAIAFGLSIALIAPSAAAAQSGTAIQEAGSCLANDPVCVEPGANPTLTAAQAAGIRQRIERESAGPLYIAVLPPGALDSTGGSMDQLLREVAGDV